MDKPEPSNPVYKYPDTPRIIRKAELLRKIIDIRDEIEYRKNKLNYNIFAGVTKKSIDAQKQTISELELQKTF